MQHIRSENPIQLNKSQQTLAIARKIQTFTTECYIKFNLLFMLLLSYIWVCVCVCKYLDFFIHLLARNPPKIRGLPVHVISFFSALSISLSFPLSLASNFPCSRFFSLHPKLLR